MIILQRAMLQDDNDDSYGTFNSQLQRIIKGFSKRCPSDRIAHRITIGLVMCKPTGCKMFWFLLS